MDKTEYSYGRWCTVVGQRYMILDSRTYVVEVYKGNGQTAWFDKSVVSEVSDFMQTDAERKAVGYAF